LVNPALEQSAALSTGSDEDARRSHPERAGASLRRRL